MFTMPNLCGLRSSVTIETGIEERLHEILADLKASAESGTCDFCRLLWTALKKQNNEKDIQHYLGGRVGDGPPDALETSIYLHPSLDDWLDWDGAGEHPKYTKGMLSRGDTGETGSRGSVITVASGIYGRTHPYHSHVFADLVVSARRGNDFLPAASGSTTIHPNIGANHRTVSYAAKFIPAREPESEQREDPVGLNKFRE